MRVAKITVTTFCGAMCKSCPSWRTPNHVMELATFQRIIDRVVAYRPVRTILLNNVGDLFSLANADEYLDYAISHKGDKRLNVTTNGLFLRRVPPGIDELDISFNGFSREGYEYLTGLPFDIVYHNIRRLHASRELYNPSITNIHMLRCKLNVEPLDRVAELFSFLDCPVRVSHKCENQFGEDHTLDEFKHRGARIPCDYLDRLNVHWNGDAIMCAHDFDATTVFGNVLRDGIEAIEASPVRQAKIAEHQAGVFTSLCTTCNYNVPIRQGTFLEFRKQSAAAAAS